MKRTLGLVLALSAMVAAAGAGAQTAYPEKAVRIVVGFPPGGPSDIAARLLGQRLEAGFGRRSSG